MQNSSKLLQTEKQNLAHTVKNKSDIKGNISEARILLEFLKYAIPVSMPYGNKQPYDFLVDLKNKFLRIQVKTASTHHEKVSCKFKRISTVSLGKKQKDYIGKIDYFAIYYPEKELICLIPEQVTRNKADRVIVRYENPKRTPDYSPNMILAQDYTMEKFLSKHGVKV